MVKQLSIATSGNENVPKREMHLQMCSARAIGPRHRFPKQWVPSMHVRDRRVSFCAKETSPDPIVAYKLLTAQSNRLANARIGGVR